MRGWPRPPIEQIGLFDALLIALWAKADAYTPKGDVGPVDFDPVMNSQDPESMSFKVHPEKLETDTATIAVDIIGYRGDRKPAIRIVYYEFLREAGG